MYCTAYSNLMLLPKGQDTLTLLTSTAQGASMLITPYAHNDKHLSKIKISVINNVLVGLRVFDRFIEQPL